MGQFRFGPAQPGEPTVFGAARPGYSSKSVEQRDVDEWILFMRNKGIQRICCLLPRAQLAFYRNDLLASYRDAFGPTNVCHVEIEDYHLCSPDDLEKRILPFLIESDSAKTPVVVHCSGGSGRTGHVLAAWLVRQRGLTVDKALEVVRHTGRNPREAVDSGNAREQQLRELLGNFDR